MERIGSTMPNEVTYAQVVQRGVPRGRPPGVSRADKKKQTLVATPAIVTTENPNPPQKKRGNPKLAKDATGKGKAPERKRKAPKWGRHDSDDDSYAPSKVAKTSPPVLERQAPDSSLPVWVGESPRLPSSPIPDAAEIEEGEIVAEQPKLDVAPAIALAGKVVKTRPAITNVNWPALAASLPVGVRADSDEFKYCEDNGYPYYLDPNMTANPHGVSALLRRRATAAVLAQAIADRPDLDKLHILDMYGNDRTLAIAKTLCDKAGAADRCVVDVAGEEHVPADRFRRSRPGVASDHYDALLFVNFYGTAEQPLTPGFFADCLRFYRAKYVYVLAHHFPDAFGPVDKTGAWWREPEAGHDLVIMRASPDPKDRVYGPHPANSWMQADGRREGVSWTHRAAFGSLSMLSFHLSEGVYAETPVDPVATFKAIDLPDLRSYWTWFLTKTFPAWFLRACPWLGMKRILGVAHLSLVVSAKNRLRYVKLNFYSLRTAHTHILDELKKREFQQVFKCFPGREDQVARAALAQAVTEVVAEDESFLAVYNYYYGPTAASRAHNLNAVGADMIERVPIWPFICGAIALLAFPPTRILALEAGKGLAKGLLGSIRTATSLSWAARDPLSSACIEEALRVGLVFIFGWPAAIVTPFVFALAEKRWNPHYISFFDSLLGHAVLQSISWLSAPIALATHLAYNLNAAFARPCLPPDAPELTPWLAYRETFLEAPIDDVPPQDDLTVRVSPVDLRDARVHDRIDVRAIEVEQSRFVEASHMDSVWRVPATDTYHWNLVPHNAPYFVPGISGAIIGSSITRRLTRITPLEQHPSLPAAHSPKWMQAWKTLFEAYEQRWDAATLEIVGEVRAHVMLHGNPTLMKWKEVLDPWMLHLPSANKKKYEAILATATNSDIEACPVPMFNKRNEKLYKRTNADYHVPNALDVCARTIGAVRPQEIFKCGPYSHEAMHRLKEVFSPRPWDSSPMVLRGIKVYWIYGPMQDVEFAEIATRVCAEQLSDTSIGRTMYLIAAGDDNIVWLLYRGLIHRIESDFSRFDQSKFLVCQKFGFEIDRAVGVPPEIIEHYEAGCVEPCRFPLRRIGFASQITRDLGTQDTGRDNTSTNNTEVSIGSMTAVLLSPKGDHDDRTIFDLVNDEDDVSIAEVLRLRFLDYGLAAKILFVRGTPTCPAIQGAIFLKHVLMRAMPPLDAAAWSVAPAQVYLACPLPSRFLKIGTSLRAPSAIYRVPEPYASQAFLRDQARGIRAAWLPPLLSHFVRKYDCAIPFPTALMRVQVDDVSAQLVQQEHRMRAAPGDAMFFGVRKDAWTVADWTPWCVARYGPAWLSTPEFAEIFLQSPAFCFLEHPIFEAMARADYA